MVTIPLRPKHGGFLRAVSLGLFIRDYLMGKLPFDTPKIDPNKGSYQSDIFYQYKMALIRTTAEDKATRMEEKQAKKEQRIIDPDKIDELTRKIITRTPYKAHGCRFHSFVVYFSNIQRLCWVEPSGREEPSEFQDISLMVNRENISDSLKPVRKQRWMPGLIRCGLSMEGNHNKTP